MPATAHEGVEETPGLLVVVFGFQDPDTAPIFPVSDVLARGHVVLPENGEEKRTRGVHDRYVREAPVTIVGCKGLDDIEEKRVLRCGGHCIVRDSCWVGSMQPGGIGVERIETTCAALPKELELGLNSNMCSFGRSRRGTYVVQINVGPTKMRQNKVADCVCPLNRERVLVVRLNEPGVFANYELARGIICPQLKSHRQSDHPSTSRSTQCSHLVLVVLVHIPALLDRFQPSFWDGLINVGLVYYFRD